MAAVLLLGRFGMAEWSEGDGRTAAQLAGTGAMVKLVLFGYGFPVGLGLCLAGAAAWAGASRSRILLLMLAAGGTTAVAALIPPVAALLPLPALFGVGGVSIMLLFLLVLGGWAHTRARLDGARRTAADLQGAGYLCFATAAWHLCGVAAMPGHAADLSLLLAMQSHGFVVRQLQVVLGFTVLGWLLTAVSFRLHERETPPG